MSQEDIEYHKFLNKLLVIKNSITLICFIVLAIKFNEWWIVLFAFLFMSYIGETEDKNLKNKKGENYEKRN